MQLRASVQSSSGFAGFTEPAAELCPRRDLAPVTHARQLGLLPPPGPAGRAPRCLVTPAGAALPPWRPSPEAAVAGSQWAGGGGAPGAVWRRRGHWGACGGWRCAAGQGTAPRRGRLVPWAHRRVWCVRECRRSAAGVGGCGGWGWARVRAPCPDGGSTEAPAFLLSRGCWCPAPLCPGRALPRLPPGPACAVARPLRWASSSSQPGPTESDPGDGQVFLSESCVKVRHTV